MRAFCLMLIVMIPELLKESWANERIPWNDNDLNRSLSIWPNQKSIQSMDRDIWKSLDHAEKFFEKKPMQIVEISAIFLPYLANIIDIASTLENLFIDEAEWSKQFFKIFHEEVKKFVTINDIGNMADRLKTIKESIDHLGQTLSKGEKKLTRNNIDQLVMVANGIRVPFSEMINAFDKHDSKFREYPMITAPFLIEMGLIIASIEPVLVKLLDQEANQKLSCKIRDVMLDYLPLMVAVRLEKVHTKLLPMTDVRYLKYNANGYEAPYGIACRKMVDPKCTDIYTNSKESNTRWDCLVDDLSTLQFYKGDNLEEIRNCEMTYARHLRTLVERMFPIGLLNKTCGEEPKRPTGNSLFSSREKVIHIYNTKTRFLFNRPKTFHLQAKVGQQSN